MKKQLPIFIAVVVVVAGLSFFGGLKVGQKKSTSAGVGRGNFVNLSPEQLQQRMQQDGANGGMRRIGNGSGFVNGEIISQDEKSLTVKASDGGSKIIFFSDKTQVMKMATSTVADLKTGDNIMVNGSANQDGSVNADSIQL